MYSDIVTSKNLQKQTEGICSRYQSAPIFTAFESLQAFVHKMYRLQLTSVNICGILKT